MQLHIFLEDRLGSKMKIEKLILLKKHSENAYLFVHIIYACLHILYMYILSA